MPLLRGLSVLFLMKQKAAGLTGDAQGACISYKGPRNNKQLDTSCIPVMQILFIPGRDQRELALEAFQPA